ncbi:MAG: hypothetical protein U5K54_17940 [Cytophagales bacterium]|nr:hypothetical protein [Cytophagales bacterium]
MEQGSTEDEFKRVEKSALKKVTKDYERALASADPDPFDFDSHEFAPTPITKETGNRSPVGAEKISMVDAALHAVDEILKNYPEALFYGQDVGKRLGGVFREAATLAQKYGDERVFNTPIQEAYLVWINCRHVGCRGQANC